VLNPEFEASVTPDRKSVAAGEPFSVEWTGPDRKSDFVTIVKPDAKTGSWTNYAYTSNGNPLKLTAPIDAGDYEVRYILGRPYKQLAATPITVTKTAASLDAPDTASAGAAIEVSWTGPNTRSDFVTVTRPDAEDSAFMRYFYTLNSEGAKSLAMPIEPGDYEIRYVFVGSSGEGGGDNQVIARRPITITAVDATLDAPDTAQAGQTIAVEWTGPATRSDFITVVLPDAPDKAYTDYKYARNGSPANIRMPLDKGDYELRYVQKGNKVLARRPISISGAAASLSVPETAKVGAEISVEWEGPKERSDFITVTKPDAASKAYTDYAYTRNGSPSKITMPLEPGDYEIRFVQNNKKVLARQAITIEDISVTLDAPKSAKAGSSVEVSWDGPVAYSDWITVVAPDAAPKKYKDYYYPRNGSPADLTMPKTPGDYEIRYVLNGKRVVARVPITVTE